MSKGRRVPPATPPRVAAGLNECNCDTCRRVDRILHREIAKIESVAMTGYRDNGRGVVRVALCEDCGEHIADGRPDEGIAYLSQSDTAGWPAGARAEIAAYQAETSYIVLVADHSIDKATVRQIAYTRKARAA